MSSVREGLTHAALTVASIVKQLLSVANFHVQAVDAVNGSVAANKAANNAYTPSFSATDACLFYSVQRKENDHEDEPIGRLPQNGSHLACKELHLELSRVIGQLDRCFTVLAQGWEKALPVVAAEAGYELPAVKFSEKDAWRVQRLCFFLHTVNQSPALQLAIAAAGREAELQDVSDVLDLLHEKKVLSEPMPRARDLGNGCYPEPAQPRWGAVGRRNRGGVSNDDVRAYALELRS